LKGNPSRRDRIRAMRADLKMPGSLEALDAILAAVDGGAFTIGEAIEELLGSRIQFRNNRRLQAAMRSSRLPAIKTLGDFDFAFQPSQQRLKVLTHPAVLVVDEIGYLPISHPGAFAAVDVGRRSAAARPRSTRLNSGECSTGTLPLFRLRGWRRRGIRSAPPRCGCTYPGFRERGALSRSSRSLAALPRSSS
jgi:hypothetical protein